MNLQIYAFALLIIFSSCLPTEQKKEQPIPMQTFDWQGHRGSRGALPENTIPAFLFALQFPYIQTLELDVVVSADSQIIVSHEPYFSHHIASHPDGRAVTKEEELRLNIYEMTLAEVKKFDVGQRGNAHFPKQLPMAIAKPSFKAMVKAIDNYCSQNDRPLPRFNIELKSRADAYDKYMPQPKRFVQLLLAEIEALKILDRCNLQSFDTNILEAIHLQSPTTSNALLVEELDSFENHLATISFQPTIYSPFHEFVTASLLQQAKAKGIKVIPWTVNELKDMQRLKDLGVDGIITDYVDRIAKIR